MARIMRLAGVPAFPDPFQSLRRSAERDWLDQGFDLPTVAAWMGHSPAVAMRYYTRAEPAAFARAAASVE